MIAARPPMGWNSWNIFRTNIAEALICQMADVIWDVLCFLGERKIPEGMIRWIRV